jgi:hypothetical protein
LPVPIRKRGPRLLSGGSCPTKELEMTRYFLATLLGLVLAACGGGNGVTGPSGPSYPQVAGNYTGTLRFVFPEISMSVSCPVSTSVTQAGNTVNIAPLSAGGDCGGMSIPVGSTTIDAAGGLGSETSSYNEPSCGLYNYTASGGFYGTEFRFSLNATSTTCLNMNITGSLYR